MRFEINESSCVAAARRHAVDMASREGFSEERAGTVAIVVTEAATNLLKHAGTGELHLRTTAGPAVEVVSVDRGPGMSDADACLADGYSSSGTSGTGMGAIRRASAQFDLYSQQGRGTVAVARILADPRTTITEQFGVMQAPVHTESVCGDSYATARDATRIVMMVADGLGHGPLAAEASMVAVQTFHQNPFLGAAALVERCHHALRPTRGAAIAVAVLDLTTRVVTYSGIGNIAGLLVGGSETKHMVSHNGTAGHQARRIQEFTYEWRPGTVVIMHSDGLATHWTLTSYPGLQLRDPSLIAAVLYRDQMRGRDDVTVLVWKDDGK